MSVRGGYCGRRATNFAMFMECGSALPLLKSGGKPPHSKLFRAYLMETPGYSLIRLTGSDLIAFLIGKYHAAIISAPNIRLTQI